MPAGDIIDAIDHDTAVVELSHVNYRSAEIQDMAAVTAAAQAKGALVVWDLAHSSGAVETKAQFIDVVASKKTIYKTINLSEASTVVVGNNAIARHIFSAETESGGKAGSARVGVMQVWAKQDGRWKLLARQAFRLPPPA